MEERGPQRKEQKKAFPFISSTNKAIDIDNSTICADIKLAEHSLLAFVLAKNGRESEAIDVLKAKKTKYSIARVKETVNRYIHAGEFSEALKFIKSFNGKMVELIPLECIIKIHLERHAENIETVVTKHVLIGLEKCFDRHLLDVFKSFYLASQNKADLRSTFNLIHDIIIQQYYTKLNYRDCKYLFKLLPEKLPYLQKMVQLNPLIKRKYYFMYANLFGIKEMDIKRILAAKYRSWAMCIAIFYGWVDESARTSFEKQQGEPPLLINSSADWSRDLSDEISFSRRYNL